MGIAGILTEDPTAKEIIFSLEGGMTQDDRRFIQQLFGIQTQQLQCHLSAVSENLDHKIGLIVEGHDSLNQKIDSVAADTEAHHGGCRVKEGGGTIGIGKE